MNSLYKLLNQLINQGFERFGKFYGVYKGFVVDREDPKNYSRLRLSVPDVGGNYILDWAWAMNNYAGPGHGTQTIPSVGDLVWVQFEFGNPRRPLWGYGYFGLGEKPDELKDYDNYWFKTPGGHLVELDDTNELIRITSKGNTYIIKKGETQTEPLLLGDTHIERLEALYDILLNAKVMTVLGPQPFMPDTLTSLTTDKALLKDAKSANKFIGK